MVLSVGSVTFVLLMEGSVLYLQCLVVYIETKANANDKYKQLINISRRFCLFRVCRSVLLVIRTHMNEFQI